MPFVDDENLEISLSKAIGLNELDIPKPKAKDAIMAAYRTENSIGSFFAKEGNLPDSVVDNAEFNPWDHLSDQEKGNESFIDQVIFADNEKHIQAVRDQNARELKDRETVANAGALGFFASGGMAMADPINFIPVGGVAYKTYKTGGTILSGAAATATTAGVTTSAQEASLHATQLQRTFGESAINVTGAMLLSGVIGATPGLLKSTFAKHPEVLKEIDKSMDPESAIARGEDSVGAEAVFQEAIVKGKFAKLLTKVMAFDPLSRTITSDLGDTRSIASRLAESPIAFEKTIGTAVESRIKVHDGKYYLGVKEHLSQFKKYKKRGGKLKRREFGGEVSKHIRNETSDIPEVIASAESWNKNLYDPLKDAAVDVDLLPEGITINTAKNYLNRLWDKQTITRKLDDFVDTVVPHIKEQDISRQGKHEAINIEVDEIKVREKGIESRKGKQATAEKKLNVAEGKLKESRSKIEKDLTIKDGEDTGADKKLRESSNRLQDDISGLKGEIKTLESEVAGRQKIVDETKPDLEARNKAINIKEKKIASLEKQLATAKGGQRALRSQIQGKLSTKKGAGVPAALRARNNKLHDKISGLESEIKTLKGEVVEGKGKTKASVEEINRRTPAIKERQTKIKNRKAKLRSAESDLKKVQADTKRQFELKNVVVSKKLTDADMARNKKLNDEVSGLKAEVARLSDEIDDAETLIKVTNEKLKVKYPGIEIIKRDLIDLEDIDYENLALQIATRIRGTPDGRLPYDYQLGHDPSGKNIIRSHSGSELSGNFHRRAFDIPDDMVEDFLINDIELLGARYLRNVAPDVELTKEFGDVKMVNEQKIITEAWDKKIKAEPDPQKRQKMEKKKRRDVADVAAMRDRMRGTFAMVDPDDIFVRAGRLTRDINYLRLMGGVTAASIPDVARAIMAEGIGRTFRDGLVPLGRNLKAFRMSAEEGKLAGVATDALMGGRAEILADIADYSQGGTAFERIMRSAATKYSNINLMNQWTGGIKQLHIVTMQTRVIKMLKNGGYDQRLGQLGISEANGRNIGEQLNKHAELIDGVWIANTRNWDNLELANIYGAALRKESDRVIVVPGQEKPLFMSKEMGKTIFQFRSFMMAATQRMLIAGIQGQDLHYLQGMVGLISLGMMSYSFKQWDAGRDVASDPTALVLEGIDRSGVTGIIMEINNTIERASRQNIGLRPLLGVTEPSSRFASRSAGEALMGPTFGSAIDNVFRVLGAAGSELDPDGEGWGESDTRAFRRLLPWQNLMLFRQLIDKLEAQIHE